MPMLTAAPGFVDMAYLYSRRVTEVGWEFINEAVTISANLHTQALLEVMETFVKPIDPTKPRFNFRLPVSTELQPLQGADDSPIPTRGFDKYVIAVPIRNAGFAWGNDRISRVKMTVEEANDVTLVGLNADKRWMRRHLLASLLNNVTYNFADEEFGTLAIKPLANSDSDKFNLSDGQVETDNHYLAQSAAIDDTHNPFPTIEAELTEHPTNTGDVVVYVSTSLKASITALTAFVPYYEDQRIQPGISQDLVSSFPATRIGDHKLGEINGCYIVEWKAMPAGYMIAHCPESGPFVGLREEPEAELQGLRVETHEETNKHVVYRLLRRAGFAVRNRIAAVCYYVGDASYVIPTGYAQVLKV
jgi:hypothetical protein